MSKENGLLLGELQRKDQNIRIISEENKAKGIAIQKLQRDLDELKKEYAKAKDFVQSQNKPK